MQSPEWIAWNIFLAVVPVAVGYLLAYLKAGRKRASWSFWLLVWFPLVLIWLAFLPNTCYLMTEWRHFLFDPHFTSIRAEGWNGSTISRLKVAKQALFFLVYSGIGVLCYTLSIRPIERIIRHPLLRLLVAVPFFFLTSLGVYMGLDQRLNSWQVVTQPQIVWKAAVHAVTTPLLLKTIAIFAALLWLLYKIVDIWVDGVAMHLKRGRSSAGAGSRPKAKA